MSHLATNFDAEHARLTGLYSNKFDSKDLDQFHDKLFWNNNKEDVLTLIKSLEWPIFEKLIENGTTLSETFRTNIEYLWCIYATEATCMAPPWRSQDKRVDLAAQRAKEFVNSLALLLEDVPAQLSAEECSLIIEYNKDLLERYRKAAEIADREQNAVVVTGAAVVAFLGAVAVASNRRN